MLEVGLMRLEGLLFKNCDVHGRSDAWGEIERSRL